MLAPVLTGIGLLLIILGGAALLFHVGLAVGFVGAVVIIVIGIVLLAYTNRGRF